MDYGLLVGIKLLRNNVGWSDLRNFSSNFLVPTKVLAQAASCIATIRLSPNAEAKIFLADFSAWIPS